tara:strand:- start:1037 stop:1444 length:408 start_codon:yes stop_codon:yes gene_type:complete
MFKKTKLALMALIAITFSIAQNNTIDINKKKLEIGKTDVVFKVKGMVCSFCAQGLQKSLSKLSYVDKKNYTKGVKVNLKDQVTIISTKAGAKIDYNLAVKKIADAGYSVEEAYHNPTGLKVEQVLLNTATKKNNN